MKSFFDSPDPRALDLLPAGFRFASAACGLKKAGQPDLGLITCEEDAVAAAGFTTNRVKAAPVLVSRDHLRASGGRARAVIANSGNANCATGHAGLSASRATAAAVGRAISCKAEHVLVCSTGIIGVALDHEKILGRVPALVKDQADSAGAFAAFAGAIMTTDTRPKWSAATCQIGGKEVRLAGCAKGAGMIHPQLATMLAFVVSDVTVSPPLAQRALERVAERTFNAITVDGDTSTNDTLILLTNGTSGAPAIRSAGIDYRSFFDGLERLCRDLACAMVADGEGATRVAEIEVRGAASDAMAAQVARTVASSPLVKTALAGADPNWGRILAAAGRVAWPKSPNFDFGKAEIQLGGITVCRRGQAQAFDESAVHQKMLEQYVSIVLDLKRGRGRGTAWACDLTEDYVRLNKAYRS